jgi:hypothetical protein
MNSSLFLHVFDHFFFCDEIEFYAFFCAPHPFKKLKIPTFNMQIPTIYMQNPHSGPEKRTNKH